MLNIVNNELQFTWLKRVHFPALHCNTLTCIALYCTAQMLNEFVERYELTLKGTFEYVKENSHSWLLRCKKIRNLGFLRVRKIPLRKLLKRYEAREAGF